MSSLGLAQDKFEGGAFHPQLPGGRASGTLLVSVAGIRFESPHGAIVFPLSNLQLEMGGAGDRMCFFKHSQFPGCSLFTTDKAILKHPALAHDRAVSAQRSQWGRRRFFAVAAAVLLVLAIPMALWLAKDPAAGLVARNIPVDWEVKLGETVFEQVTNRARVVTAPELNAEFSRLVQPLFAATGTTRYQFQVHIVEDLSLNAFALPGGIMVVHSGLILKADRAEEVLGVMGHELAHVTQQHSLRAIVQRVGLIVMLQFLIGSDGGLAGVIANSADFLLGQKFSRDHEREADNIGFDYLVKAGIDPQGLITFFEKIQKEQDAKLGGAAEVEASLSFLSTHPGTDERIEHLRKRIAKETKGRTFQPVAQDFKSFQDRLRQQLGTK